MKTDAVLKAIIARKVLAEYPDAKYYCAEATTAGGYQLIGVILDDGDTTITRDSGQFVSVCTKIDKYLGELSFRTFDDTGDEDYVDVDLNTGKVARK